jgi:UPF0271 protein
MDINCDMGESFGNWKMGDDAGMMPLITTANVACGFHASDPVTMLDTIELAGKHDIQIGAHPGLPDLVGFGRRVMNLSPKDAYADIVYQVGALQAALHVHGLQLHHIKPHGAMLHVLQNEDVAGAVADAITDLCDSPLLYWPAPLTHPFPRAALKKGIRVVGEIYPDLSYGPDGSLIIQREKHETDVDFAVAQVRRYVETGKVESVDGSMFELEAESVCVHGDGPNSVDVATAIKDQLEAIGCAVKPIMNGGAG